MPSISENEDKSANLGNNSDTLVFTKEIDAGAELVACYAGELDAVEALRIRHVGPFFSNGIWSPGKQLIWLRTSAWPFLRCDLSIYLLVDIIGAAIYPRLISSDGLNSLTSPGLGLSSTWVI